MEDINFKRLCDGVHHTACVVSVQKLPDGGYGEIRIVDGNQSYLDSFKGPGYFNHSFVPNSIYTDYLEKNLNFEDYSYRSAVKKELLHSYAYPEYFKSWMHMIFIPLAYETKELSYCMYIMEVNDEFNPELLSSPRGDIYSKVLNTTLQLANTADFNSAVYNVTKEIRKICNALFCCILLVDEMKEELTVLAEDREQNSYRKAMKDYMDDSFYNVVKTWDDVIDSNGNCIIIKDEKGMEYLKEKNPVWHKSLTESGVSSLVLFKIKSGNNRLGYMWVSDFKSDDTPKIKEALEITTFVLGAQISNQLLLKQLTELSSIDLLTKLNNRNKFNAHMKEIAESEDAPTGLIFLDINGLKKVNDQEGHLAGDNLIVRAANALKAVFGNKDIFRVGGDEFVVILRNIQEKQIIRYLEVLQQKAQENRVSFAVGYAMTNTSKEIEKILKEADMNMYNDKRKFYKK